MLNQTKKNQNGTGTLFQFKSFMVQVTFTMHLKIFSEPTLQRPDRF